MYFKIVIDLNHIYEIYMAKKLKLSDWFINQIYPIGSIYMSVNSTNPTNFFGGTWEQIKDRFLLCAGSTYVGGKTGGSTTTDSTKLTIEQIPSHDHIQKARTSDGNWNRIMRDNSGGDRGGAWPTAAGWTNNGTTVGYTNPTGGGEGHSHTYMPPYLAVYVWKRTA